jgi:endonuclease YncB( thermonuclease family)
MITRNIRKLEDIFPLLNVRVIDGDTLQADIALAFETNINRRIRLKGWWAPEQEAGIGGPGFEAKHRLDCYCAGKALWIHCPAQRLDKYGRIIAALWYDNRIISAGEVLGTLQMTEKAHREAKDEITRHRAAQREAGKSSGTYTPDPGAPMFLTGDGGNLSGH